MAFHISLCQSIAWWVILTGLAAFGGVDARARRLKSDVGF